MSEIIWQVATALFGLWIADKFIPGVKFLGPIKIFFLCGLTLGLVNFFIKPFLKKITFPLRFLSFGLFDFFLNMVTLWFLDILFPELEIVGVFPLFLTTCLFLVLDFFFGHLSK